MASRKKYSRTIRFTVTLLLFSTLTFSAYFLHIAQRSRHEVVPQRYLISRDLDNFSKKNRECRQVHHARDKCKYVRKYCADENPAFIPYLTLYYCNLDHLQPLSFVILVLWNAMLFSTIGIAASDFFSVNLSTIATTLGLSESLAGVTFLALGNGSPDVFSTFAAMGSNSSSMAIGELIGAAGFITAVVAGSMALIREFRVSKRTFIRDISFFIVAASFTFFMLLDGHLYSWECVSMIGFYCFYVIVVVGWHWYTTRRCRRRALDAVSRSNFATTVADVAPYQDMEDDNEQERTNRTNRRKRQDMNDVRILEESTRAGLNIDDDESNSESTSQILHVAAEMTSSMRIMRPQGRCSNTTVAPIRSSLIGALEFRSVLSSLQRQRNMSLCPLKPGHGRSHSATHLDVVVSLPVRLEDRILQTALTRKPHFRSTSGVRERALSSGDAPHAHTVPDLVDLAFGSKSNLRQLPEIPSTTDFLRTHIPNPTSSYEVGGESLVSTGAGGPSAGTPRLQLEIMNRSPPRSEISSPMLSPFPPFTSSSLPTSPTILPQNLWSSELVLPSPNLEPGIAIEGPFDPKPVCWWPYEVLPAPHILSSILFPTLQGWSNKGMWDKFVSLVSVPSIFLLIITLPVVETASYDDQFSNQDNATNTGTSMAILRDSHQVASQNDENEWQQYRQAHALIGQPPEHSHHSSPFMISIESHDKNARAANGNRVAPTQSLEHEISEPLSKTLGQDSESFLGWNRWLVAVQITLGPMFVIFIIWMNIQDELDNPFTTLFRMMLFGWLISLVLLGLLFFTTSPDRKPRFHFLLCFLGFVISIAWISTVAGEVVGVLKAFGVILGISEAILGLTVFAMGNSLGDLVADITVARLGYPMMAL